jgi:protein-tyrosine phosphatase
MAAAEPASARLSPAVPVVEGSTDTRRVLGLQGATNFRDLGGYQTTDGRRVRWNMVYRSNKLSALTPADQAKVDALHLGGVVDLRTIAERNAEPDKWRHRPAFVYESGKNDLGPVTRGMLANASSVEAARQGVADFYAQMPDLYRPEYAALFKQLAAASEPLVIHCTAGKDRTGVASALLLTALRVPRATVVSDYALTSQLLAPLPAHPSTAPSALKTAETRIAAMSPEVRTALWRADPLYITTALDAVTREYGSIDNYMKTGLGMTDIEIAALRRKLTE